MDFGLADIVNDTVLGVPKDELAADLENSTKESTVEIRLYNHATDKFLYKRLTEYEWDIVKNMVSHEKWEY